MVSMFKVNLALLFSLLFWASAFVGIRIGLESYSPGALALFRFLVASVCMVLMNHQLRVKTTIPWKDRIQIALLGLLGIGVYNVCLNYGEVSVSAGVASFLIGLMPVITVLLSLIILKEKLSIPLWIGIFVSLFGLILIIVGESSLAGSKLGVGAILIAALAGSLLNILQMRFLKKYHTVEVTAWVMWGGTLSLLYFWWDLATEFETASFQATAAVIYMGIFPAALAYAAWGYVQYHLTASRAAIYLYAMPIISTIMGYFVLHEIPTVLSFVGGLIALIGALMANRAHKHT